MNHKEKKLEYIVRILISLVFLILGVFLIYDEVSMSKNNGFQIVVGLELLAGSYFVITKQFQGFKQQTD